MDLDTTELLRKTLRPVLTETSDRPLATRLADLGWDDVLADDAPLARCILFETKGETLSAADALGPLLAEVAGAAGATVVLPSSLHPDRLSSVVNGNEVVVAGVVLAAAASIPLLVPVEVSGTRRLALTGAAELKTERVGGFDPDLGLASVNGRIDVSTVTWLADRWDDAVAAGRCALAAELTGIGRRVVADAVAYTGERHQYGRPIGSFQAVQHRLASAHASVVGASHAAVEAARTGSAWAAMVAKALAGHAAEDACTQAQQSYGAIGFTWEHSFHRYLRRMYLLDRLLGSWRELEPEIGAHLQATGEVSKIGTL